jgi:hypothetical protein
MTTTSRHRASDGAVLNRAYLSLASFIIHLHCLGTALKKLFLTYLFANVKTYDSPLTHSGGMQFKKRNVAVREGCPLPGPTSSWTLKMDDGFYRLEMRILSACNNNDPRAAAKYRSRGIYHDKLSGRLYDFSNRSDLIADYVLLPNKMPLQFLDNEFLWDTVYEVEHRVNARYCREIQVALPSELPVRSGRDVIKRWAKQNIINAFGVPCHVSVHFDSRESHLHAHIAFPERQYDCGEWSLKIRKLNSNNTLLNFRKSFADSVNATLEALGSHVRVDHRSNHTKQCEAMAIVNDKSTTYEKRIRAYARFISLEYFVAGKVSRNSEYRENIDEHPDVKRSRKEREAAKLRAQEFLDQNIEDARMIDRYLAAKNAQLDAQIRRLKTRQNKKGRRSDNKEGSRLRAAISSVKHPTSAAGSKSAPPPILLTPPQSEQIEHSMSRPDETISESKSTIPKQFYQHIQKQNGR